MKNAYNIKCKTCGEVVDGENTGTTVCPKDTSKVEVLCFCEKCDQAFTELIPLKDFEAEQ